MKLAFAIFRYFPFGGLQRDMLALALESLAQGHQVTVFCGAWEGEKLPGVDIQILDQPVVWNIAGVRRFIAAFVKTYNREAFDLLVGFNKMPGLDVYFAGDTCFAHKAFSERHILYAITPRARLYLRYEQAVFGIESQTQILSISQKEQRQFARYYGTSPARFNPLPPGISKAHIECADPSLARKTLRAELGLSENTTIVLCVGSGFRTKGIDISIAAFAQLRGLAGKTMELALVILGQDDPGVYRRQAQELNIAQQVFFVGGRSPIGGVLQAADVLLHPARQELAGNAIIEAMAVGKPVVVSENCGYAHYVADYDGGEILSNPVTSQEVASALLRVLSADANKWRAAQARLLRAENIFSRAECAIAVLERINAQKKSPALWSEISFSRKLFLCEELIAAWQHQSVFKLVESLSGTVTRAMPDRSTLKFEWNGRTYYRKWHSGVGWKEIFKNLLQGRLPVTGASNEWHALHRLRALSIPSLQPVAYGEAGWNIAKRKSFLVTRELDHIIQLDHLLMRRSLETSLKWKILTKVAHITRELHGAGINHRDLYLCHYVIKESNLAPGNNQSTDPEVFLMDLHRAQIRHQVPERWQVKDLAALYFSTMDLGIGKRDIFRFLRVYFGESLRRVFGNEVRLLDKIQRRAIDMYQREQRINMVR